MSTTRTVSGRLLRYLWTDEGLVNEQIVRDGFATLATFPPDIKYVERIRAAQQEAYDAGRGLWGEDAYVEPPALPTQPMLTATSPAGQMTWYTSSHSSAQYYYCELDPQWKCLSPAYLRSYPSEAACSRCGPGRASSFTARSADMSETTPPIPDQASHIIAQSKMGAD